jgi:hypothetical protein
VNNFFKKLFGRKMSNKKSCKITMEVSVIFPTPLLERSVNVGSNKSAMGCKTRNENNKERAAKSNGPTRCKIFLLIVLIRLSEVVL